MSDNGESFEYVPESEDLFDFDELQASAQESAAAQNDTIDLEELVAALPDLSEGDAPYEPHQEPPGGAGNTRNGATPKTLITEHGKVGIDAPRDRDGSFAPKIVRKRQRRFQGFDDKIMVPLDSVIPPRSNH